ncbi:MAG: hypothetical protein ACFKPT_30585 [Gloeotrichia echinulata GP01]
MLKAETSYNVNHACAYYHRSLMSTQSYPDPEVLNLATKLYNTCVLPRLNPLPIENRVINHSNLVSASPMHNLGNILQILTFNTSDPDLNNLGRWDECA